MSHDETKVVELSESPGRRLRVQRQNRGLEVERIAAQLHVRTATVEALEQDRYQDLPGPVFVIGYLRNYARLLEMDSAPLLAAYRTAHPLQEPAPPRVSAPMRREIGSGHILMRLISLAVLAVVIGMLVLWWQSRADLLFDALPDQSEPGLALAPTDEPGAATDSGEAPGLSRLDPIPSPPEQPQQPNMTTTGSGASPQPGLEPLPTTLDEPPTQPVEVLTPDPSSTLPAESAEIPSAVAEESTDREIVLAFSGTSWIDVRDSSGKSVLTGDMHKGDRHVLDGTPPFAFVIGNAKFASISVGGKPFDLGSVSRGGVARFKLDPAGAQ